MTSKIAAWQNWTQNQIKLVYLWSCLTEAAPNPICATGFSPEETCKGGRGRRHGSSSWIHSERTISFATTAWAETQWGLQDRGGLDLVPEQTIASQCFPFSEPLLCPHLTAALPVTTALSALSCRRTGEGWINCLFLLLECFQRCLTKTDVLRRQETICVNMLEHWPCVNN